MKKQIHTTEDFEAMYWRTYEREQGCYDESPDSEWWLAGIGCAILLLLVVVW